MLNLLLFSSMLLKLHVFVLFPYFFLFLISVSYSTIVRKDAWYNFDHFLIWWDLFCSPKCDLFWRLFCMALKKMSSALLEWNVLNIYVKSFGSNVPFKATVSLLIFCLDELSVDEFGVLKSYTFIILLLISSFIVIIVLCIWLLPS